MQTKKIAQLTLLAAALLAPAYTLAQDRVIDVNVKQVAGPLPATFNFAVGAGRANEGLRADWQQQLAEIKRDAGLCGSRSACSRNSW